jgi:hypothetical protein
VVLAMTLIVFAGLHAVGNPADILLGEDMNQQERLAAIARLGLDQPLWRQYLGFLEGLLRGELGRSFVYRKTPCGSSCSACPPRWSWRCRRCCWPCSWACRWACTRACGRTSRWRAR